MSLDCCRGQLTRHIHDDCSSDGHSFLQVAVGGVTDEALMKVMPLQGWNCERVNYATGGRTASSSTSSTSEHGPSIHGGLLIVVSVQERIATFGLDG